MAVTLGINALHAGASAALLIDGKPVAAIAEERLNRVKYYAGFPKLAILKCLDMAGIGLKDVDYVVLGNNPRSNSAAKLKYTLSHPMKIRKLLQVNRAMQRPSNLRSWFASEFDMDPDKLQFKQYNMEPVSYTHLTLPTN